jgi:hypothetical protein
MVILLNGNDRDQSARRREDDSMAELGCTLATGDGPQAGEMPENEGTRSGRWFGPCLLLYRLSAARYANIRLVEPRVHDAIQFAGS